MYSGKQVLNATYQIICLHVLWTNDYPVKRAFSESSRNNLKLQLHHFPNFYIPQHTHTHCAASPQFPGKLGMIFDVNQGYQIQVDNLEPFYVLVCCKYALFFAKHIFSNFNWCQRSYMVHFYILYLYHFLPNHPCIAFVHSVNMFPSNLSAYPFPTMQGGQVKLKLGISEI